jgi:hypothetical protein
MFAMNRKKEPKTRKRLTNKSARAKITAMFAMVSFGVYLVTHLSVTGHGTGSKKQSYALATKESFGFFDDISNESWNLYKQRFQSTRPNLSLWEYSVLEELSEEVFWSKNYDPEFTCPHEVKIGGIGDGGKWVCDPHRIDKDNCLVYSIGSHGDFSFEKGIYKEISKSCTIHTFDMNDRHMEYYGESEGTELLYRPLAKEAGVEFHQTMLGTGAPNAKRFKEIISDLKHEGKTIDILKIDCEGCEYGQYLEWFQDFKDSNVIARNILVELHGTEPLDTVQDFFAKMLENGYVIYHKEPNLLALECIEMAFILLDQDFQKKKI